MNEGSSEDYEDDNYERKNTHRKNNEDFMEPDVSPDGFENRANHAKRRSQIDSGATNG